MNQKRLNTMILIGVILLCGSMSHAQSIAPQAVLTSGLNCSQAGSFLSFTIGDIVVKNQTDASGNSLGNGFTSAATGSTTVSSIDISDRTLLRLNVYPNPASNLIIADISAVLSEQLRVEITELQGRTILRRDYAAGSTKIEINTSGYAPGGYILQISKENGALLGNCKFFKQN